MTANRSFIGDWISVRAYAEREPLSFTVSITLGELPAGWARSKRSAATKCRAGIAGLVLVAPFALLVGAGFLHAIGLGAPYSWISFSPAAILAASVSLFIGLPVAFAINIWPITWLGMRRQADELEGVLALEVAPLQLVVVVVALLLGGLFAGHLAADSYACLNGVHSAC
jgi:hypothetical protein